jgi:hypothetical protein
MRVSPPLPLSAGIAYQKQAQRASLPACDIVIMPSSPRSCSADGYDDPLQRLHSGKSSAIGLDLLGNRLLWDEGGRDGRREDGSRCVLPSHIVA